MEEGVEVEVVEDMKEELALENWSRKAARRSGKSEEVEVAEGEAVDTGGEAERAPAWVSCASSQ